MGKIEDYQKTLSSFVEWKEYLLAESNLPGPRGNLELAKAVSNVGDEARFMALIQMDRPEYKTNTPGEFLIFCGVVGLGKLLAEGRYDYLSLLRSYASDSRWRVREAVAMALQTWGMADFERVLDEVPVWVDGNCYEQRAVAAGLCEPVLLKDPIQVGKVLSILAKITAQIPQVNNRKGEDFQALRKGMAYCWSVAAAASPDQGKKSMELWFDSKDKDIRWIMRENLKKNRLVRMDPEWVQINLERFM